MDIKQARELFGESERDGVGLDKRLRKLGIDPKAYRARKERERNNHVRSDVPTPRASPSSPHLNLTHCGNIAK
jgi:hypothetical protein